MPARKEKKDSITTEAQRAQRKAELWVVALINLSTYPLMNRLSHREDGEEKEKDRL